MNLKFLGFLRLRFRFFWKRSPVSTEQPKARSFATSIPKVSILSSSGPLPTSNDPSQPAAATRRPLHALSIPEAPILLSANPSLTFSPHDSSEVTVSTSPVKVPSVTSPIAEAPIVSSYDPIIIPSFSPLSTAPAKALPVATSMPPQSFDNPSPTLPDSPLAAFTTGPPVSPRSPSAEVEEEPRISDGLALRFVSPTPSPKTTSDPAVEWPGPFTIGLDGKDGKSTRYLIENNILGLGNFGAVWPSYANGQAFAVKVIKQAAVHNPKPSVTVGLLRNETNCLKLAKEIGNPYLGFAIESFQSLQYIFMIMPKYDLSLSRHIDAIKTKVPMDDIRFIASRLVSGIRSLHSYGIYHLDLKIENTMLDFHKAREIVDVHIIDYGLSQIGSGLIVAGHFGTPGYMAPELTRDPRRSRVHISAAPVDIYALGMVLKVMYMHPEWTFRKDTSLPGGIQVVEDVGKLPQSPHHGTGPEAVNIENLIEKMLEKEPNKRISIGEIVDHKFFAGHHIFKRSVVVDTFPRDHAQNERKMTTQD
ncbi:kinase-like domain-containing protein [Mycena floridula]|nr:kinase-like domain-containing protein [Mycena floridula]